MTSQNAEAYIDGDELKSYPGINNNGTKEPGEQIPGLLEFMIKCDERQMKEQKTPTAIAPVIIIPIAEEGLSYLRLT